MAKAKPKRKAKLTVDDNPKVTPQYRESGGPIDTIWCIVIRDHKGNEVVAAVTVPPADEPLATLNEMVNPSDVPTGIVAVPTHTAEPLMVGQLERIMAVLIELGWDARIVKFFVMKETINASTVQAQIQKLWDVDRAPERMNLYARALTAMREISDQQQGGDKRADKTEKGRGKK